MLPLVNVVLSGVTLPALVDTGCSTILVRSKYSRRANGSFSVVAFDGRVVKCRGKEEVRLGAGDKVVSVEMIVVEELLGGVDVVVGIDTINQMDGLSIQQSTVTWGIDTCCAVGEELTDEARDDDEGCEAKHEISDKDFSCLV